MLFDSWAEMGRVLLAGILAYAALIAVLRVSGKRTLSKMNAFDLVVTVALGSTLATVLLSQDVALAEGILALALLIGLQYAIAWLSVRSEKLRHVVKAQPRLLFYRGGFLEGALRAERVTREEVKAAVRSQGMASMEAVDAVILETDGTMSVIREAGSEPHSALDNVAR